MTKVLLVLSLCVAAALAAAQPASPDWGELSAHQQRVLAPVSGEWNRFAPAHKARLLAMVPLYDQLAPAAQQRFTVRLKTWAELTGEQQDLARQHWQRLQALPAAQRAGVLAKLQSAPTASP
ncbi:MAG: DUF3106 domain-containing protein [Paludibacterium sp.]|uniref:DUF3106 domain-containing protein n=1 Tax=Paludibacterium sp. TaxID=1917523 RepID=UPI0025CBDE49|nr:DUF3106 domain-containing protein [Paludibacterium sp.]MBV8046654.1 DUF3106 domain-containing protein [Paludibacterium sp.]MBV8647124.1 DUF3106 domain-containing protein [Paludibacterium sp.]